MNPTIYPIPALAYQYYLYTLKQKVWKFCAFKYDVARLQSDHIFKFFWLAKVMHGK